MEVDSGRLMFVASIIFHRLFQICKRFDCVNHIEHAQCPRVILIDVRSEF